MLEWSSPSHNVRLAYSCTVANKPVERPLVSTVEVLIGHGCKVGYRQTAHTSVVMRAHGMKTHQLVRTEQRTLSEVDSVKVDQISSNGDSLPPPKRSVIVRDPVPPQAPRMAFPKNLWGIALKEQAFPASLTPRARGRWRCISKKSSS